MPDHYVSQQSNDKQQRNVIRVIKIFVSSPSDVATERQLVKQVVDQLNTLPFINEHVLLKLYAYEQDVPPATGKGPQMIIDQYMPTPDQVDIFICLLRNRMGTPFQDEKTGKHYVSGTEYEFICAYQANLVTKKPAILLYRCTRPTDSRNIEPTQFARVRAFFDRFSGSNPEFKGFYKVYSSLDEFERTLFQDLATILRELIEAGKPLDSPQTSPPTIHIEEPPKSIDRTNVKHLELRCILKHHQKAITDVCFAVDMPRCISASRDRSLVFYDIEHQHIDFTQGNLQDDIQAVAYHPTSSLLAGVNQGGEVIIWDTRTYQMKKTLVSGSRYLTDVAFSTDGMSLCAISRTGIGWYWKTDTWEMSRVICRFSDAARSLAFSPDGNYLAIACINGTFVVSDCHSWTQVINQRFNGEVNVVQFIPGQPLLALGFEHGEIQLWDYQRSLLLASLIQHRERITGLAAMHDGQLLFSSGNDQRLIAWDIEQRISLFEINTENDAPLALALHPQETILAAGMASGHILWYMVRC
jgi:WD40 repeat protein